MISKLVHIVWIICIILVWLVYFWFLKDSDVKNLIDNSTKKVQNFVNSKEFQDMSSKLWNELKITAWELKESILTEENKKKALEIIKKESWVGTNKEAEDILKVIQNSNK